MVRAAPFAFVFAAALALAAAPTLAGDARVTVGHNKVDPATLTVKAGTTVTFHNVDEMPGGHSVAADDGSFQSPALAKDASWSYTFAKPGSYGYKIREHPGAKGTIVVE